MYNFRDNCWWKVTIEEFRERMGCAGIYSEFSELRRNVIEKSLKEMNKDPNIEANCEYIKKSKKVSHLFFRFMLDDVTREEQQELPLLS
jgi:plasmid replication initiation protein